MGMKKELMVIGYRQRKIDTAEDYMISVKKTTLWYVLFKFCSVNAYIDIIKIN